MSNEPSPEAMEVARGFWPGTGRSCGHVVGDKDCSCLDKIALRLDAFAAERVAEAKKEWAYEVNRTLEYRARAESVEARAEASERHEAELNRKSRLDDAQITGLQSEISALKSQVQRLRDRFTIYFNDEQNDMSLDVCVSPSQTLSISVEPDGTIAWAGLWDEKTLHAAGKAPGLFEALQLMAKAIESDGEGA